MTGAHMVDDARLDDMTETIGRFRELAHAVLHAREQCDIDAICEGMASMEALFQSADSDALAAALLERLFAADWAACQDTSQLLHLLP